MLGGADHGMPFRGGESGDRLWETEGVGRGEAMCRPRKQNGWWICEEGPLGVKNHCQGPRLPEGKQACAGSRCSWRAPTRSKCLPLRPTSSPRQLLRVGQKHVFLGHHLQP